MRTILLTLFCLLITTNVFSQDNSGSDSVEVYLIDNYVTSEKAPQLIVSFYTSIPAKSKIIIDNQYEYVVSDTLTENHKDSIDISNLKFKSKLIQFVITGVDSLNRKYTSDLYEIDIPKDVEIKEEANLLLLCLMGGAIFILPSPVYVNWEGKSYFSLTKEIPLVFFKSGSFAYPAGYLSLEYSFVYQAPVRSFLRFGYKHIIEVHGIEYISPGINAITNLDGYNGISPELSIGWFRIFDTFTVYSRYRINFKPGAKNSDFSELFIGLYSGFFAIYF